MAIMQTSTLEDNYAQFTARRALFIFVALAVLLVLIPISASWGPAGLAIGDVFRSIGARLMPFLDIASSRHNDIIVWDLRLPRVMMAVVGGAGFALSGAAMQGILRNPLVSPFTLGISSAAGFGAALVIVAGVSVTAWAQTPVVSNAFGFALLAAGLVFFLARMRGFTPETLILAGIAIYYVFSALTSSLQYAGTQDEVAAIVFWLLGSMAKASWTEVLIVSAIFACCLPLLLHYAWDLNAMAAGDETATALGTNIKRVRLVSMMLAALIAASVVAFNGVIGFVCLVSPHITRMMIGGDHRFLLPACCLVGAILLLTADTLARNLFQPLDLPVGIMTAFIGVPFFAYLLISRRREYFQ